MTVPDFIKGLSEKERNFIAHLDYGNDSRKHRIELDCVINSQGRVDHKNQGWYPYEVIELGKNWLQDRHEREFVACAGIVLQNICDGSDICNDWNISMSVLRDVWDRLLPIHRELLEPLTTEAKKLG